MGSLQLRELLGFPLHIVSQEREAKAAERAFWHEARCSLSGPSQNDSEWAAIFSFNLRCLAHRFWMQCNAMQCDAMQCNVM